MKPNRITVKKYIEMVERLNFEFSGINGIYPNISMISRVFNTNRHIINYYLTKLEEETGKKYKIKQNV